MEPLEALEQPQRPERAEAAEGLEVGDGARADEPGPRDGHAEAVDAVPVVLEERPLGRDKPEGHHLEDELNGEDGRQEPLHRHEELGLGPFQAVVLDGQRHARDEDAERDEDLEPLGVAQAGHVLSLSPP